MLFNFEGTKFPVDVFAKNSQRSITFNLLPINGFRNCRNEWCSTGATLENMKCTRYQFQLPVQSTMGYERFGIVVTPFGLSIIDHRGGFKFYFFPRECLIDLFVYYDQIKRSSSLFPSPLNNFKSVTFKIRTNSMEVMRILKK